MDTIIGFDSAWSDKNLGAICAIELVNGIFYKFHPPCLVSFAQALTFIDDLKSASRFVLVAIDQPTIVPNLKSMRPADRAAASLVGWLGGGVQPANRGRLGMFCDASPIWRFLRTLQPKQNPEMARSETDGVYLIEVFPALALASLGREFFRRSGSPKYNPARKKTFRLEDWGRVSKSAEEEAAARSLDKVAEWCRGIGKIVKPRKADQDMLDSVLCALVALRWRLLPRDLSLILGDLTTGYMVFPASPEVRKRLSDAARKYSVPIDGTVPAL